MFDNQEESASDRALREGLVDLPTPEVSADFDGRIQSALQRRASWRQVLWMLVGPALPTAACTLVGMLALVNLVQNTSAGPPTSLASASVRSTMQNRLTSPRLEARQTAPEESADSVDLKYASLSFFSRPLHRITDKSG